jgi:hypothetical protein
MSITWFVAGLGVYLRSAQARQLEITVLNGESMGNSSIATAFIAVTVFIFL